MRKPRAQSDFAQEALRTQSADPLGHVVVHDLHRDLARMLAIEGEVDGRRSAGPEPSLDLVGRAQRRTRRGLARL